MGRDTNIKAFELARARTLLHLQSKSRSAARRTAHRPDFSSCSPDLLIMSADHEKRKRLVCMAAAAHHGAEIARSIGSAERAAIVKAIGEDARRFGISNRSISVADVGEEPFDVRFHATVAAVDAALTRYVRGKKAENEALCRCLEAAIAKCQSELLPG